MTVTIGDFIGKLPRCAGAERKKAIEPTPAEKMKKSIDRQNSLL
jgi:hypothetical protein